MEPEVCLIMRCKVFCFRIKEFRALAFEGTAFGLSAN